MISHDVVVVTSTWCIDILTDIFDIYLNRIIRMEIRIHYLSYPLASYVFYTSYSSSCKIASHYIHSRENRQLLLLYCTEKLCDLSHVAFTWNINRFHMWKSLKQVKWALLSFWPYNSKTQWVYSSWMYITYSWTDLYKMKQNSFTSVTTLDPR